MPIRINAVYCVNHPNTPMTRNEGFNALTGLEKNSSGVAFNPSTGIPIVTFFCDECGYIEMYAATKTPFWK